jgi:hypothetical protein
MEKQTDATLNRDRSRDQLLKPTIVNDRYPIDVHHGKKYVKRHFSHLFTYFFPWCVIKTPTPLKSRGYNILDGSEKKNAFDSLFLIVKKWLQYKNRHYLILSKELALLIK